MIQDIIGYLLYYSRSVDPTILKELNTIILQQSQPTIYKKTT